MVKSKEQCSQIEQNTREQTNSDEWWKERKVILTASTFSEIYHRRKQNCEKLVERLQKRPYISDHMPASVKHGLLNETTAARKYSKFMFNIGHNVEVLTCGLVMRPDIPILGASTDARVLDPKSNPHYGILEIKCPYKYRCVAPIDAAQCGDSDFCLEFYI